MMYIALALILSLQLQIVSSFVINNAGIRQHNSFAVNKFNNYKTELLAVAIPVETFAVPITAATTKFSFKKYFSNLFKGVATNKIVALGALIVSALFVLINEVLWKPSRTYDRDENSVGREYDAWTTEGILEEYWGEHIHLGYYSPEEMKAGYKKKNFIQAKYDFVDEMIDFGQAKSLSQPMAVLDVGCGIGGKGKCESVYAVVVFLQIHYQLTYYILLYSDGQMFNVESTLSSFSSYYHSQVYFIIRFNIFPNFFLCPNCHRLFIISLHLNFNKNILI
jgi:hypothetical protein